MMYLLTCVRMRNPPKVIKILYCSCFANFCWCRFLILYNISPDFFHIFVVYVEEKSCHTCADIINAIQNAPDESDLAAWRTEISPTIARGNWYLGTDGTVLGIFYVIRADEAEHRDVNHACTGLKEDEVRIIEGF